MDSPEYLLGSRDLIPSEGWDWECRRKCEILRSLQSSPNFFAGELGKKKYIAVVVVFFFLRKNIVDSNDSYFLIWSCFSQNYMKYIILLYAQLCQYQLRIQYNA